MDGPSYSYLAVDGLSPLVPWILLAGLGVSVAVAAWLTRRVLVQRRRLAEADERLDRLARTDALTGLFNRRYINEQLGVHCSAARRHDFCVAVLVIDVDRFKQLNDTFGYAAGDEALRHVADRLARSLRTEDLAGRWEGDEFIAVLPHTSPAQARLVAERMRADIAGSPVLLGAAGDLVTVSVSVGVAAHHGELPDMLVYRAAVAVHEAKYAGRNRVCVAEPTSLH